MFCKYVLVLVPVLAPKGQERTETEPDREAKRNVGRELRAAAFPQRAPADSLSRGLGLGSPSAPTRAQGPPVSRPHHDPAWPPPTAPDWRPCRCCNPRFWREHKTVVSLTQGSGLRALQLSLPEAKAGRGEGGNSTIISCEIPSHSLTNSTNMHRRRDLCQASLRRS